MIRPTELRYIKKTNILSITFEDGYSSNMTSEYLRCFSPSAEVKGHGPGQEKLQINKEDVVIDKLEPVGNYAVRIILMMAMTQDSIHGSIYIIFVKIIKIIGIIILRD